MPLSQIPESEAATQDVHPVQPRIEGVEPPPSDVSQVIEMTSGDLIAETPRVLPPEDPTSPVVTPQLDLAPDATVIQDPREPDSLAAEIHKEAFACILKPYPKLGTLGLPYGHIVWLHMTRIKPIEAVINEPTSENVASCYKSLQETYAQYQTTEAQAFIHDLNNTIGTLLNQIELAIEENTPPSDSEDVLTAARGIRSLLQNIPNDTEAAIELAAQIAPLKVRTTNLLSESEVCPLPPTALHQVIINAGFNAKTATANNLTVIIQAGKIQLVDNGNGFTFDSAEEAAEASRAINPLKGNGLGIIRRLCETHGGTLHINNREETRVDSRRGAILTLQFPTEAPTEDVDTSRTSIHLQTHQLLHRAQ